MEEFISYKLFEKKGLLIVEVDNELFLVDTGLPFSFRYDGTKTPIHIGSQIIIPSDKPEKFNENESNKLMGINLDGYLGCNDILRFPGISIIRNSFDNKIKNNSIIFDVISYPTNSNIADLKCDKFPLEITGISLDGKEINDAILETGSPKCYINPCYFTKPECNRRGRFYSIQGWIDFENRPLIIKFNNKIIYRSSFVFNATNRAFISSKNLFKNYLILDFKNKKAIIN